MSPDARARACALILLACLSLAPTVAFARWYQVDVVVFRNSSSLSKGGETWPERIALPDFSNSIELITDLPSLLDEPPVAGGADAAPIAFQALAPGERRLAGIARRLSQSSDYQPLITTAWRQPSFGVGGAKRVRLFAGAGGRAPSAATGPAETAGVAVEGTVSIKVSRLLYTEIDFLYNHAGTPVRLHETRRMKLREIHYFDHPLFGVIVQVTPWALPEAADTAVVGDDEPEDGDEVTPPSSME